jgi:hypothetical protein
MIIKITLQDIWDQFVYFRKNGLHKIAFTLIRRYNEHEYTHAILGSIAHRKYNPRFGDIIMLEGYNLGFVWSQMYQDEYSKLSKMDSSVSTNNTVTA